MVDSISSPFIVAAGLDTFQSLVVENSHKGPVLVNFWSRRAGPCLRQYPVLDQVVHHFAGRLLLVNVDTESEIALSKQYGVTSVPTLKLFRHGAVLETRHGYQSQEELVRLLDEHVVRDSDQTLAQAIARYAQGEVDKAYSLIANAIVEDPINPRLPLAMCKLLKHEGRYAEALTLLDSLPDSLRGHLAILQFRNLVSFAVDLEPNQAQSALQARLRNTPDDHDARRALVAYLVLQQDYEQALEQLAVIIDNAPNYGDNYAQQAMLKVFTLLGPEHPAVAAFRPRLRQYTH